MLKTVRRRIRGAVGKVAGSLLDEATVAVAGEMAAQVVNALEARLLASDQAVRENEQMQVDLDQMQGAALTLATAASEALPLLFATTKRYDVSEPGKATYYCEIELVAKLQKVQQLADAFAEQYGCA